MVLVSNCVLVSKLFGRTNKITGYKRPDLFHNMKRHPTWPALTIKCACLMKCCNLFENKINLQPSLQCDLTANTIEINTFYWCSRFSFLTISCFNCMQWVYRASYMLSHHNGIWNGWWNFGLNLSVASHKTIAKGNYFQWTNVFNLPAFRFCSVSDTTHLVWGLRFWHAPQ